MILPTILDNIMFSLGQQDVLSQFETITLLECPTTELLKRGKIHFNLKKNEFLVIGNSEYLDINIGSHFAVIVPRRDIRNYVYCDIVLRHVSINPSYKIDYLPKGYSGLCLLEFPNGKPGILKKLAVYGEKKDSSIHDMLILTQKPVLEKVLSIISDDVF